LANVQVWSSQLAANDFPPVCAMTGAPAEMWRKFTFTNTPGWAYLFGAIGAAAFSSRVSGYLPLTRQASKRITTMRWILVGLIPVAVAFWVAAGIIAPSSDAPNATASGVALGLVLLGLAALLAALIGAVVVRHSWGPGAKVIQPRGQYQSLVELRRVHPAFVAAVQQLQQARAAQFAAAQPPAPPPPPPQSPFPPGKFSY
jgi:hypothetical protein